MKINVRQLKKPALILLSVICLVLLWWLFAAIIDVPLILPSPAGTFSALWTLLGTADFWKSLGTSILHIYFGLAVGVIIGVLVGILTWKSDTLNTLLTPVFSVMRSTPVACFIIVMWIFVGADNLPFVISIMMVAPVVMTGTKGGLDSTPKVLLEAADSYHLNLLKKIRVCYLPALIPHLVGTIVNAIGLAWKAGIAAEVIVRVEGTVGYAIWDAKSWEMDSAKLFAWTIAIILLSLAFEYLFKLLVRKFKPEVKAS